MNSITVRRTGRSTAYTGIMGNARIHTSFLEGQWRSAKREAGCSTFENKGDIHEESDMSKEGTNEERSQCVLLTAIVGEKHVQGNAMLVV